MISLIVAVIACRKQVLTMRRSILLTGVLPFVTAFLGAALAIGLLIPPLVAAQPGQLQAPAYVLVGPDGADAGALESNTNPQGQPISSLRLNQNGALRVRMETGRNGPP